MKDIDLNQAEIKKFFTEQELRIVARFMDFITKNQPQFSDDIDEQTDEEIKNQVREYIRVTKARGHYRGN